MLPPRTRPPSFGYLVPGTLQCKANIIMRVPVRENVRLISYSRRHIVHERCTSKWSLCSMSNTSLFKTCSAALSVAEMSRNSLPWRCTPIPLSVVLNRMDESGARLPGSSSSVSGGSADLDEEEMFGDMDIDESAVVMRSIPVSLTTDVAWQDQTPATLSLRLCF